MTTGQPVVRVRIVLAMVLDASSVTDAPGSAGHLWKLVCTFDDPSTWTEPGVRHLAANGIGFLR